MYQYVDHFVCSQHFLSTPPEVSTILNAKIWRCIDGTVLRIAKLAYTCCTLASSVISACSDLNLWSRSWRVSFGTFHWKQMHKRPMSLRIKNELILYHQAHGAHTHVSWISFVILKLIGPTVAHPGSHSSSSNWWVSHGSLLMQWRMTNEIGVSSQMKNAQWDWIALSEIQ